MGRLNLQITADTGWHALALGRLHRCGENATGPEVDLTVHHLPWPGTEPLHQQLRLGPGSPNGIWGNVNVPFK
jgi:hypothetical protein